MKPKHHFLVCMNQRPAGHPRGSCGGSGASSVFEAFQSELEERGRFDVLLTGTYCMGPCDQGPTVVAYPEGIWYVKVTPEDVAELLDSHLDNRGPVERLQLA